tara:strand:+ start:310 stop:1350 length:1041 start_codon:yes stop_codon:yes gene_type:complete
MLKFSTYEKAFEELLENEGLKKKAAKSGISYGTLKKVYNRGMAAWRTGHRPGTTPQQWGMARVNSYIGKGKGTYYGADADLRGAKRKTKKEALDDKDKSTVKDVIKGLKKAVNIHKSQAATLTKDIKDDFQVKEISKSTLDRYIKKADADKSKKHVRADVGKISRDDAYKNQIKRNKGIQMAKAKMNPAKVAASEATVKEISKGLAMRYIGKASRDVYHKGQQQGTADAISRLGGPTKDYKKSPERKAAKRVAGIDRATKITSMGPLSYPIGKRFKKNEAMSDAEKAAHQKAIDAFKAKGGKIKKLKPGYAQGYHGKADPGAGMKGMISPADTKQFGTKKKIGSMK